MHSWVQGTHVFGNTFRRLDAPDPRSSRKHRFLHSVHVCVCVSRISESGLNAPRQTTHLIACGNCQYYEERTHSDTTAAVVGGRGGLQGHYVLECPTSWTGGTHGVLVPLSLMGQDREPGIAWPHVCRCARLNGTYGHFIISADRAPCNTNSKMLL